MQRNIDCCRCRWVICSHIDFVFPPQASELDGEVDLSTCYDVKEFPVQRNYGFQILVGVDCSCQRLSAAVNHLFDKARLIVETGALAYKQPGTPSGATRGVTFSHFSSWDSSLFVVTDVTWPVNPLQGLTSSQSKCATAVASRACFPPTMRPSCWTMCLLDLSVHVC